MHIVKQDLNKIINVCKKLKKIEYTEEPYQTNRAYNIYLHLLREFQDELKELEV